ncbi:MAG: cell division protein SepF [Corynebacterium sp.]|nr:cell division protein SepF [Corynebacterium sp.]
MTQLQKIKEFFGLDAPMDAYYEDDYTVDPRSGAAYKPVENYSYRETVSRSYSPNIVYVRTQTFDDCTAVAEPFRDGDAVVFDMGGAASGIPRRIVDFASGLCFALRGTMRQLDSRIFAIIPEGASVSTIELERAIR